MIGPSAIFTIIGCCFTTPPGHDAEIEVFTSFVVAGTKKNTLSNPLS